MIDPTSLWRPETAGGLLLPIMAAIVLSLFGRPWMAFAATERRVKFADRWTLFAWFHPFWAALIVWVLFALLLSLIGLGVADYSVTPAV